MVNSVSNDNKNYAIGAGVGALGGLGAGYLTRYTAVSKEAAAKSIFAQGAYNTAKEMHLQGALTSDQFIQYGELVGKVATSEKAVKIGEKMAKAAEKSNPDKAVFHQFERFTSTVQSGIKKLLKTDENKSLGEAVEKATKEFNEGAGKEFLAKANEATKAVKTSKGLWIAAAGLLSAGVGLVAAHVVNKKQAQKAEVPAENVPAAPQQ